MEMIEEFRERLNYVLDEDFIVSSSENQILVRYRDVPVYTVYFGKIIFSESAFKIDPNATFGNSVAYDFNVIDKSFDECYHTLMSIKEKYGYFEEFKELDRFKLLRSSDTYYAFYLGRSKGKIEFNEEGFSCIIYHSGDLELSSEDLHMLHNICDKLEINIIIKTLASFKIDGVDEIKIFTE